MVTTKYMHLCRYLQSVTNTVRRQMSVEIRKSIDRIYGTEKYCPWVSIVFDGSWLLEFLGRVF